MVCVRLTPFGQKLLAVALVLLPSAARAGEPPGCGTTRTGERDLRLLHAYAEGGDGTRAATRTRTSLPSVDDNVAVLEDRGDLVIAKNPFDLDGHGVRLVPNREGGFDPMPTAATPGPSGTALAVGEDTPRAVTLPFAFPFFGEAYREVFVHADGNLTLGTPDSSTGERGLSRFLAGPPRIAPFFADLDPARGGVISARLDTGRAAFLWDGLPGGGQVNHNTFEVALLPDGTVEFAYGREVQTREAVVGVSPGASGAFTVADLTRAQPVGSKGALVERFSEREKLDLVSVTRRFLASHADTFHQIVVYTSRPLNPVPGTLAFEINVRNDVQGIGLDTFDHAAEWGSAGMLESVVYMDSIDPYLELDGFEFLAHEV